MALVYKNFDLKSFDVVPGVASPTTTITYTTDNGVTLASSVPQISLVYSDSTISAAFWTITTDAAIGATPALTVRIDWYLANPASSAANVRFGAAVAVLATAGTVVNSVTKALSTAVTQDAPIVTSTLTDPTTFYKVSRTSVLLTNGGGDFVAANAPAVVGVKVFRDGLASQDTAIGDVRVRAISIVYQDT